MISHGTTRLVLCLGPYAIKIAKEKGTTLQSVRGRPLEANHGRAAQNALPYPSTIPFGVALMMKRAKPISEEEKDHLISTDGFPDWDYVPPDETAPFEYKASDWGLLEGRLVALDYSTPALFPPTSL